MEKNVRKNLSLIFFVSGFLLVMTQDLKAFSTINFGWSWPFAIMFYAGLLLMAIGYYLRA